MSESETPRRALLLNGHAIELLPLSVVDMLSLKGGHTTEDDFVYSTSEDDPIYIYYTLQLKTIWFIPYN